MTIDNSTKPKRNENIILRDLEDGTILLDVATERTHILNLYASYVWEYCDSQRSVQEIIEIIKEELKELKENHSKEIISTLEQFAKEGILVL